MQPYNLQVKCAPAAVWYLWFHPGSTSRWPPSTKPYISPTKVLSSPMATANPQPWPKGYYLKTLAFCGLLALSLLHNHHSASQFQPFLVSSLSPSNLSPFSIHQTIRTLILHLLQCILFPSESELQSFPASRSPFSPIFIFLWKIEQK